MSRRLTQVFLVALGAAAASGIAASGCSSFEPVSAPDAGSAEANAPIDDAEASAPMDAGSDAALDANATCDANAVFDPPALLAGINTTYGDYAARLTNDELTVYFSSGRMTGTEFNIYIATRASILKPFDPPSRVSALSSPVGDAYPSISADGLEVFLSRASSNFATYEIYVARRAATDAGFSTPTLLAGTNDTANADLAPFVAQNGDLYFESARRAATGTDIFYAARMSATTFAAPKPIEELSTPDTDGNPVLSFDMLTIYFTSARPENNGDPAGDIWVAHRPSLSAPFGDIKRVAELSTKGDIEYPTWLSGDNCRLYMSVQKAGQLRAYVATRRP